MRVMQVWFGVATALVNERIDRDWLFQNSECQSCTVTDSSGSLEVCEVMPAAGWQQPGTDEWTMATA